MRKIIYILCLVAVLSCNKEEDGTHDNNIYKFISRECKYAWAYNGIEKNIDLYGVHGYLQEYLHNNESVSIKEYLLSINTCNVGIDELSQDESGKEYCTMLMAGEIDMFAGSPYILLHYQQNNYQDKADEEIEYKLLQYYESKKTKSSNINHISTTLVKTDYRTTPLKNINITSSADICGIKAGESLNNLFFIRDYESYYDFIITDNKNLITDYKKIHDISIDQYLSYHPMAPADVHLKFVNTASVSTPTEVTFTVELTTDKDEVIRTKTHPIVLVP